VNAHVDISAIEDVDTVWRGGTLLDHIPGDLIGRFDLLIASHVLEHIPDLIGFLDAASSLLKPDGKLSIALPDRRYCFDCFKPWTTTGELLEAHHRGLTHHSLKTAFNDFAYSALIDGGLAWGPQPVNTPVLMSPFQTASDTVFTFGRSGDATYQDHHAWQFTPAGFALVMLDLGELELTDWVIDELEGPQNFEFFASLRRSREIAERKGRLQVERRDLLMRQLMEVGEQVDFMLKREPVSASTCVKSGVPADSGREHMDRDRGAEGLFSALRQKFQA
jgi:SAM-dependent methyltransferase